jgi:hypothetical protein
MRKAEKLDEARQQAEAKVAEVREAARLAVVEANAGRDRAEGIASELRTELEATRQSADAALAAARTDAAVARDGLEEQLAGRYEAERAAAPAEADAQITRAQVRAESAQELAENRAAEDRPPRRPGSKTCEPIPAGLGKIPEARCSTHGRRPLAPWNMRRG